MQIDTGCGSHKRTGFIGVDVAPGPQVDIVLDIERDTLPFDDDSVDNESIWKHICYEYDGFYFGDTQGRFELKKYQYTLFPDILNSLARMNIPFSFTLDHMFNIALEFGAFITVDKTRRTENLQRMA